MLEYFTPHLRKELWYHPLEAPVCLINQNGFITADEDILYILPDGEAVALSETHCVSKQGQVYRITDPNKIEAVTFPFNHPSFFQLVKRTL
jgi:hypothetical protein